MGIVVRLIIAAGMLAIVVFLAVAIFRPATLAPVTTEKRHSITQEQ